MANTTTDAGRLLENSGNFKSVVTFRDPVTTVSGNLYIGLADSFLPSGSPSIVWGSAQTVDGFVNSATPYESYAYSNNNISWNSIWNKYVYIRFEGTIDGNVIDTKHAVNFVGQGLNIPFNTLPYDVSATVKQIPIDFKAQIYNARNLLSYSFVSRIEWRIEYYEGNVLKTETRVINASSESNTPYRRFTIGDYNLVIKSIKSVIVRPDNSEIIEEIKPDYIILKNPVKNLTLSNVKELSIKGIHGSILHNGFIFGSGRNYDSSNYNLVKISATDPNNITYQKLTDTTGGDSWNFDQIIECSGFLYCLSSNELFQINPSTLEFRSFKSVAGLGIISSCPLLGDEEFLYIVSRDRICKVRALDLQNAAAGVTDAQPFILNTTSLLTIPGTPDNYIHSGVVDSTHVFIAITSGGPPNPYTFVKIAKSNLAIEATKAISRATDDMTQDSEFCYLGTEPQSYDTLGVNYGAYAVRKSNLEILPLAKLSENDVESSSTKKVFNSYASLFFGDFLFDFKVNNKFYQLNALTTGNWNLNIPGMATVTQYNYPDTYGIMNEVLFDVSTQTFHAFFWVNLGNSRSNYATFKIPDLVIFTNPIIANSPLTTVDPNNYILNAAITSDGGTPVTEAYFEILDLQNNQIETIPVTTANGAKSAPYSSQTSFRYRFVATNIKGTSTTASQTVEIVVPEVYKFAGTVFYDELPASGVELFLIDQNNDTILKTTVTASDGTYEFSDLEKDKVYAVFGYRGTQRIITKIKTPFLS
ncbi:hypothetical protein [Chryseobacterium sp.]|uniref:hypothetical protein n=1 Tax=Chryseobacterium sp. TaxID=1871047 RepID=UPI0012D0C030|nr:hypothetical protein [Chryseobacterium sp.]MPS66830.1 hypothetical protein [Chryseobacterium sp.]